VHGGWGVRLPGRRGRPATDGYGASDPGSVLSGSQPSAEGAASSASGQSVAVAERVPPGVPERTGQLPRLRRSVLAEIAIALAVLAVTALLVNAVPAKQAAALPFSTSFSTLGVQVNAIVDPARAGTGNQVHVYVLSQLGTPKAVPELDMTLSLPAENLGPLTVPLRISGPGHYYADNVDIPVAGDWIVRFTVRTDAIDEQVVPVTMHVR